MNVDSSLLQRGFEKGSQAPKISVVAAPKTIPSEMQSVLDRHNVYRCMHGVPLLEWSSAIASHVKAREAALIELKGYASFAPKSDRLNVDGVGMLGANMMCGSPDGFREQEFGSKVRLWYETWEKGQQSMDMRRKLIQHGMWPLNQGTQTIWRSSRKIGCAVTEFPNCAHNSQCAKDTCLMCEYGPGHETYEDRLWQEEASEGEYAKLYADNVVEAPLHTMAECQELLSIAIEDTGDESFVLLDDADEYEDSVAGNVDIDKEQAHSNQADDA